MKKQFFGPKFFISLVFFIEGLIITLRVSLGTIGFEEVPYIEYGGDAYTGIQNAAAAAANNIKLLGEAAFMMIGVSLMMIGVYFFSQAILDEKAEVAVAEDELPDL